MMKTVKKVPELRFPEFEGEWDLKKISNIAELTSSKRIFLTDYVEKGIPFFRGKEISMLKNQLKLDDLLYISEEQYNEIERNFGVPQIGDILITAVGTLGNVYHVSSDEKFYFKDGNLIWIRNIEEDPSFLERVLEFNNDQILLSANGSSQKALTIVGLNKLEFRFPSLPEQQKIASFLSSADQRIQLLTQKKEKLEQYKKGIMQQIFSQQLRFKDENGKDYPDWEEKRLGDTIKLLSDYTANGSFAGLKDNVSYYSEENYAALVRTTDLEKPIFKPERFTDKHGYDFLKKTSLRGGEIILASVGSIGKVYRVPSYNKPMTLAPNTYVIKFNSAIDENFIYQLMNRQFFKNQLLSMVGSTTLKAINKENLRSIVVEIPYIEEQQKIASFLANIDQKISLLNQQIELTRKWKQGLLQKMFV